MFVYKKNKSNKITYVYVYRYIKALELLTNSEFVTGFKISTIIRK